jgi:hypothetical protein
VKFYRALPVIPAVALIGSGWFANRVEPRVFGVPFLLGWIVGWVLLTSATMWLVYHLDHRGQGS